jgi:hypothetical protein
MKYINDDISSDFDQEQSGDFHLEFNVSLDILILLSLDKMNREKSNYRSSIS